MPTPTYLLINSRDELYRIDIARIAYFEADGNYTVFCLTGGQRSVVGMNLVRMQELLASSLGTRAATFARVGKRFIVNLRYVFRIEPLRGRLTLSDGITFTYTLNVSREVLKKLKSMYVDSVKPKGA